MKGMRNGSSGQYADANLLFSLTSTEGVTQPDSSLSHPQTRSPRSTQFTRPVRIICCCEEDEQEGYAKVVTAQDPDRPKQTLTFNGFSVPVELFQRSFHTIEYPRYLILRIA